MIGQERENIVNFNEAEDIAYIFTHNKAWQRHFEQRLKIKPVADNGCGGLSYEIPKKMVKPPRAPKHLSDDARERLSSRAKTLGLRRLAKT